MLIIFLLFAIAAVPLVLAGAAARTKRMRKFALLANVVMVFALAIGVFAFGAANVALAAGDTTATTAAAAAATSSGAGIGLLGAGIATGLSCVGAGIAVGPTASAAIGAISENPKMLVRSLIFVVIAEGIALYGMLISFQIFSKIV